MSLLYCLALALPVVVFAHNLIDAFATGVHASAMAQIQEGATHPQIAILNSIDFNTICTNTISDLGFTNQFIINFDILDLIGLTNTNAWYTLMNYYVNYIITMSVALFFPIVILTFIHWCFNIIYSFTDKEGGF